MINRLFLRELSSEFDLHLLNGAYSRNSFIGCGRKLNPVAW